MIIWEGRHSDGWIDGLVKKKRLVTMYIYSIGLVQQDVCAKWKSMGTIHFFNNHVRPKHVSFQVQSQFKLKMSEGRREYLINENGGGTYSIFYTFWNTFIITSPQREKKDHCYRYLSAKKRSRFFSIQSCS